MKKTLLIITCILILSCSKNEDNQAKVWLFDESGVWWSQVELSYNNKKYSINDDEFNHGHELKWLIEKNGSFKLRVVAPNIADRSYDILVQDECRVYFKYDIKTKTISIRYVYRNNW